MDDMQATDRQSGVRDVPQTSAAEAVPIGLTTLCLLAVLVGLITGFGAVGFRALIGLIHNLFFLGQLSLTYDANLFTPASPWGPLVILVPVIGGLGRWAFLEVTDIHEATRQIRAWLDANRKAMAA